MIKYLKFLGILAIVACASLATQNLFANCSPPDDAYAVDQCGGRAYFPAPPAGSGTVNYQAWWQIGFGNATSTRSTAAAGGHSPDGRGFVTGGACTAGTCTAGLIGRTCTAVANCNGFIGNDNGFRTNPDPNSGSNFNGILDASQPEPLGLGAPAGSICWGGAASWGAFGVDGCADNNRTGTTADIKCDSTGAGPSCGPGPPYYESACAGNKNDDSLNKYYGACNGLGNLSLFYQLDAPMGTLLKESNNKFFALGFFATQSRNGDASDLTQGKFDVAAIGNGADRKGDANPLPGQAGKMNIIPWQPIPQPTVSAVLSNPLDPHSVRTVGMSWTAVRLVDDGSLRPSSDTTLGTGRTGVGVRNQGNLVRHVVEVSSGPLTNPGGGVCSAGVCTAGGASQIGQPCTSNDYCGVDCGPFIALAGGETTGTSLAGLSVNEDRCLRMRTIFGLKPVTTVQSLANAQIGNNGDVGYDVVSKITVLGGNLVSEKATLNVAAKNKNAVLFEFTTTSELNVTSFEIVGRDANGKDNVIGKTNCKECNSGRGASYSVVLPNADVKGAKNAFVRTQPSGEVSNTLEIK